MSQDLAGFRVFDQFYLLSDKKVKQTKQLALSVKIYAMIMKYQNFATNQLQVTELVSISQLKDVNEIRLIGIMNLPFHKMAMPMPQL